ncbi:hypothetical protein [Priestia megaterium]|uniref:hypothetical protein n=1 Tax=Priestia megaterium TaxID=1404 RepID=UPI002E1BA8A8|nr:hypothetical protein [Priestia megaterium]
MKREKLLGIRQIVSGIEHDHFKGTDFETHLNEKMGADLGRAISKQIPATKEYNEELDSYIYETRAVVLTPQEYKDLLNRLDTLEIRLANSYRAVNGSSIDGWYRQGL